MLYGAIIGDMVGSRFEFKNKYITNNFDLFNYYSRLTDDSVMTCAVYHAVASCLHSSITEEEKIKEIMVKALQSYGRQYPNVGYGGMFKKWIFSDTPQPYGSYANGSAMRVSSIGWLFDSLEETEKWAKYSAEVTHNHEDAVSGAQAIAGAIYIARTTKDKEKVKEYINKYNYTFTPLSQVPHEFDVSCKGTVQIALEAVFEGNSYEDIIRKVIYVGGDTDTNACIAGSVAEALYDIPQSIIDECDKRLYGKMKTCVTHANQNV